jgi:hypothetical protein
VTRLQRAATVRLAVCLAAAVQLPLLCVAVFGWLYSVVLLYGGCCTDMIPPERYTHISFTDKYCGTTVVADNTENILCTHACIAVTYYCSLPPP